MEKIIKLKWIVFVISLIYWVGIILFAIKALPLIAVVLMVCAGQIINQIILAIVNTPRAFITIAIATIGFIIWSAITRLDRHSMNFIGTTVYALPILVPLWITSIVFIVRKK